MIKNSNYLYGLPDLDVSKTKRKKISLILMGILVGIINGFFGGGGGMIIVPCLESLIKLPTNKSHATAISIILPISIVSAIIYFLNGSLIIDLSVKVGAGVILGGILGAILLKKIKSNLLNKIFAILMLIAGIKMVFF